MRLLLQDALIIHPGSAENNKRKDILIENGLIAKIGTKLRDAKAHIIRSKNLVVCPGFVDLNCLIPDPGFEHRETHQTAAQAAIAGGFTGLCCLPNTKPVIHSKTQLEYVMSQNQWAPIDFFPIGAVSKNTEGEELTEMMDMKESGAFAFSDGDRSIENSGLLLRALQYSSSMNSLIMDLPDTESVSAFSQMNEGVTSVECGLDGSPALAEELSINRDIQLLQYTKAHLHLLAISTSGSVDLIKRAKQQKLGLTAGVNAVNLFFDDSHLRSFDTNFKMRPHLRTTSDIKAIKAALKDGWIDVISSGHRPYDEEAKNVEFDHAEFGSIGLETAFAAACTVLQKQIDLVRLVELFAINGRNILGIPIPEFSEGAVANICVFDPTVDWTFSEADIKSKSRNSAFIGATFKGKVLAVVHKRKSHIHG